ncbi:DUF2141 domain-containing protein [Parapedomonas caeni]|jgi:uncharacterized protein (DUF2141 family)
MKNRALRSWCLGLSLPALAMPGAAVATPVLGEHAAACATGTQAPAALVTVTGFKDRKGKVRIQVYSDHPDEFLAKGHKLMRVDVPTTPAGDMTICVPLPGKLPRYSLVVLHDRDNDGRMDGTSDGFAFSNNPKLGWSKPHVDRVAFNAPQGVASMRITLNYLQGLSIRPIKSAE